MGAKEGTAAVPVLLVFWADCSTTDYFEKLSILPGGQQAGMQICCVDPE